MTLFHTPARRSPHRRRRGAETQRLAASYYKKHGWPFATAVGAGEPGRDIENMPGLAPEVKARRDFDPVAWLRQAVKNAAGGDMAFCVVRPDGFGPERVEDWLVVRRLSDDARLLRAAGYGEPLEVEDGSQ